MLNIIPNYHPMMVHFTIALIITALGMLLLSYVFKEKPELHQECLIVSRWCLWLGALASILTVMAGFHAYYTVEHDTVSHSIMLIHRNWGISAFVMIELTAIGSFMLYIKQKLPRGLFTLSLATTVMLIIITGWYGAELVFRYGLGVKSLPQSRALNDQAIADMPLLGPTQGIGDQHNHDHQH